MTAPAQFPPAVRRGDRVGVAALSGPVRPERLERGVATLRALGYEPVLAANLSRQHGLFAGHDIERLDAFHALAADPDIRAIFFARGGHGVLRVLPRIDWTLLGEHPRFYVGYSDLTPLLLEVVARLGVVALHGPMVAADLARDPGEDEMRSFAAALAAEPLPTLPLSGFARDGRAEGLLLGGCLSLLTATLGTPFATDLADAIVAWEDTNEPLYRVDRMLTHLGLSGTLARVRGMVMGSCPLPGEDANSGPSLALLDVLREHAVGMRGPVAYGLPIGHQAPNWTLPLGRPAQLDSARRELVLR
jgi:muramoyltetrapeptide carboxypeptidase